MSRVSYSSAVGSLLYAVICFCPDLSYVVNVVSRYMVNLDKEHWKADQWIFVCVVLLMFVCNLGG